MRKYIPKVLFILTLCLIFIGFSSYKYRVNSLETATSVQNAPLTEHSPSGNQTGSDANSETNTAPADNTQSANSGSSTSSTTVVTSQQTGGYASSAVTTSSKQSNDAAAASQAGVPLPAITSITISAAGDCTFGSDQSSPASVNFYSVYNKKKDNAYFFRKVKKYFKTDDLTLVNLEGTLTTSSTRVDKTFAFRGNPSYVNILKKGAVEAVAFANNHCADYGTQSYHDTINTVRNAGIKLSSYEKVSIYKTKDRRIGMVSVNGLLGLEYSKNLIDSGIKKLKKRNADLIIVSMHAGIEHTAVLNDVQKQLGHYAVDKGADLVLGHHPHVLQGIEQYKGVYIVYSLGNFCFGGNTNPSDKDTMIFQQTFYFQNNKLQKTKDVRIIPCRLSSTTAINNYQPTPLKGTEKKRVIARINKYSKPYKVAFDQTGKLLKKRK